MLITLYIFLTILFLTAVAFIFSRTVLDISFNKKQLNLLVSILNCGLFFDFPDKKLGLYLNGFKKLSFTIKDGGKAKKTKARVKKEKVKKEEKLKKEKKRIPLSLILKITKAGFLFVCRLISCVQYDTGQLVYKPVMANPAVAGMAFGWSRAFTGMFPGLGRSFQFTPQYVTGQSHISGRLTLSVKNRKVIYILFQLLGDLPIRQIVKHYIGRRG